MSRLGFQASCCNWLAWVAVLALPVSAPAQVANIAPGLPLRNSSVAIADLNGDGNMDIVLVSSGETISGRIPDPCQGMSLSSGTTSSSFKKRAGAASRKGKAARTASTLPKDPKDPVPLWVHALDGATDYATELPGPPGWPRQIRTAGGCENATHPTVAVGVINFSEYPAIVVGGYLDASRHVFAFQPNGAPVPGWEAVRSEAAPFFNSFFLRLQDSGTGHTVDGSPAAVGVDESTYLQRWNGLATARQCQFVTDPVFSSPAFGDVGRPGGTPDAGTQEADGIPDAISAGLGSIHLPKKIRAYNSRGKSQTCEEQPPADVLFSRGNCPHASSPALANLDGDDTQDIVIHCGSKLQVFSSRYDLQEIMLSSGNPSLGVSAYSSPIVIDRAGLGIYETIVVGTDGGEVVMVRFDPDPMANPHLVPVWTRPLAGGPISASPVAARLRPDLDGDKPQIIVATDAGRVHVLRPDDGADVSGSPYTLGGGADGAIWSTPAVWAQCLPPAKCATGDAPMIVTGNRHGVFRILPSGYPAFDPAGAQWHTFHRNNPRTGSLAWWEDASRPSEPTRGSIGGVAGTTCRNAPVRLFDADGAPVVDYYNDPAQVSDTPRSDGRFLFEFILPVEKDRKYRVRFNNDPAYDEEVQVTAGFLARADRGSCEP